MNPRPGPEGAEDPPPGAAGGFEGAVRRAGAAAGRVAALCVLPLIFLTGADVAGRLFFDRPLPGAFELSEFLLAACVLLGAAHTQQMRGHVAVGFVLERLPSRLREGVRLFAVLALLAVTAVVVVEGFRQGFSDKAVSDQLRIPLGPFRLLVAVGGLLLAAVWVQEGLEAARRLGRRR